VITVSFASVFDVLIEALKTLEGSKIKVLSTYNPIYNGRSLYDFNLGDEFSIVGGKETIEIRPFTDALEQVLALKNLFEYCKYNRTEDDFLDFLFHEIGDFLRIPPVFFDAEEGGRELVLDPNDTVYDAMKKIYALLGGLEMLQRYSLVLDDGTPLTNFNLGGRVTEEIPSLEVRYVLHENDESFFEDKEQLFWTAFESNDVEVIRALARFPEKTLDNCNHIECSAVFEDMNYTLEELLNFGWRMILIDEYFDFPIAEDEIERIYSRFMILKCSTQEELIRAVSWLTNSGIEWKQSVNFREFNSHDLKVAYMAEICTTSYEEIEKLLNGELIKLLSKSRSLAELDDVEIFYRYYKSDPSVLTSRIFSSPNISDYVIRNEPPLKLYYAIKSSYLEDDIVESIIERLSERDLTILFNRALHESIGYQDPVFRSPNFPQDILDDEEYYTEPKVNRFLIRNPKFTKRLEFVVANQDSMYLESILVNYFTLEEVVKFFAQTRIPRLYLYIADRINQHLEEKYKDLLYVEPTASNFNRIANDHHKKRMLFYRTSVVTRENLLEMLCDKEEDVIVSRSMYEEIYEVFGLSELDVKDSLECNR
jgi:hypothetical protein